MTCRASGSATDTTCTAIRGASSASIRTSSSYFLPLLLYDGVIAVARQLGLHRVSVLQFGEGPDLHVVELVAARRRHDEHGILLLAQRACERVSVFRARHCGDLDHESFGGTGCHL